MYEIRRAEDRGHADHGWLRSAHTFSFANYHDPAHMGFGPLRVINEDVVEGGKGFGTHPHRDMEIISYVLDGALEHRDSMGTGSVIRPGELQLLSAGTGVTHSEFNASPTDTAHFLQIWIVPAQRGTAPRYEQRAFPAAERSARWVVLAAPDGAEGGLTVGQDVRLYGTLLAAEEARDYRFEEGRTGWLQVARGEVRVSGETLRVGDGLAIADEATLTVTANAAAELLLFDLPAQS